MHRRTTFAAFAFAIALLAPCAARADDTTTTAPEVTYPSRVLVELGTEAMGLTGGVSAVAGFAGGVLMGIDHHWSAGVTGSALAAPFEGAVVRVDAEARYHPLMGRWGDVWVGGGAGVGVVWGFHQGGPATETAGPHVAASAGVDFHPVRGFSIGLHSRVGAYLWSVPGTAPTVYPEASLAIVLAVHDPKTEPQPRNTASAR